MRPKGSKTELESRRFQAFFLYCQGKPVSEIACTLTVKERSVKIWIEMGQKSGLAGLASIPHPGNPKAWTEHSLNQLRADLLLTPQDFGFREDRWNGALVAKHIENRFGIHYHKKYIQEFLRNHSLTETIWANGRAVRS